MKFFNRWEIDEQAARHRAHPVLGPATRFLQRFRDAVDARSDGWAYWGPPVRACKKLFELIEGDPARATEAALRKAMAPVRAFATRRNFELPELEPAGGGQPARPWGGADG